MIRHSLLLLILAILASLHAQCNAMGWIRVGASEETSVSSRDTHTKVLLAQTPPKTNSNSATINALRTPHTWIPRLDPFTNAAPHTIAVCAIMKDERPEDVKEFIDYHRWVGVDTFYLRENGDQCAIKEQLQPYIQAGVLDLGLLPGPKHPTQTNWYNECSRKASRLHSWVAFVDLDEFIVVLKKKRSVTERNALKMLLRTSEFRYTAAISLQWVLFGSAGHKEMPAEGQLNAFNMCTGVLSKQTKCLGSSFWFHHHATFRPTHVHQCNFKNGAAAVLGNADPVFMGHYKILPGQTTQAYSVSYRAHLEETVHKRHTEVADDYQVVLFHYVTRSQNYFVEHKINRRSGVYATSYAELQKKDRKADPDTLYKRFEREYGFDGTHSICRQGSPISDAIAAARTKGWSPIPSEPGFLGSKKNTKVR